MDRRSVLILCDDVAAAASLARSVEHSGVFRAATASITEAVDAAARVHPHVLLLDLPKGSRRDGAILGVPGSVPVVTLTEDAIAVGARNVIIKPVSSRELHLVLELAITRAEAARQVHDIEDRFFNTSIDMLCYLGFNGYFRRLNPAWERTLGFSRDELMARPFIQFVHPDDRARTLAQNREVRGGGRALGFENRYVCRDGSYRWLHWNAAPDLAGNVIYSVARDVTDRKRADEEREQLVVELRAALEEVAMLRGILPICSYCRKIRNDADHWQSIESLIAERTPAQFSHSICPSCYNSEVVPALEAFEES